LTPVVTGEERFGAGDLLKQFSAKATAKTFAADERGSTLIFGGLGGPHPTCWQVFEVPKSRLTRVITGEKRSEMGDLLKQFSVLSKSNRKSFRRR